MMMNVIIGSITFAIMLASALTTLGAVTKQRAPAVAVKLFPTNGFASETLASSAVKAMIVANQGQFPEGISPEVKKLATQAFLAEPVTPDALAVLAFGSDETQKRKLMNQAVALSRRQKLVSGWMIADSGARGDIPALLNHYDTMLRSDTSVSSTIIPLMAKALENKDFVEPFADLLSKNPRWEVQFWTTVVGTPGALKNAALLRTLVRDRDEIDQSSTDGSLIGALVRDKQFETARNLYKSITDQGKSDSQLQNGSFDHESRYPPFDWMLYSTGQYGAAIADGSLRLSATPNSGGIFARQLVFLPPEILAIEANSPAIPDNANVTISLSCAEAIDRVPEPINIPVNGELTSQKISNRQSGCRFYWLDINARSIGSGAGIDFNLDSVSIRPT